MLTKILLVEDDPELANRVALWLEHQNFMVEVSNDGNDILEKIKLQSFDLVILDYDLPKITGVEICKNIRETFFDVPIIMLTGRASFKDKDSGFEAGVDDYLTKPFHLKELLHRIRSLLKRSGLQSRQSDFIEEGQIGKSKFWHKLTENFENIELIGQGGMSCVYKGFHKHLKKNLAIKILDASLLEDKDIVKRFQQEAELIAKLDHPNIISVYDFAMNNSGHPYIIMDYVEGESLAQILNSKGELSLGLALSIFKQLVSGVSHAHRQNVIHRDLNPNNLLLKNIDNNSCLKIIDFGIAKLLDSMAYARERLTRKGEFFGTSLYMSPEQCRGDKLDHRSDIYSMGVVMYESLLGLPPFDHENELAILQMHMNVAADSFVDKRPDLLIPKDLEKIVFKCLAKNKDERYQKAEELELELLQLEHVGICAN